MPFGVWWKVIKHGPKSNRSYRSLRSKKQTESGGTGVGRSILNPMQRCVLYLAQCPIIGLYSTFIDSVHSFGYKRGMKRQGVGPVTRVTEGL